VSDIVNEYHKKHRTIRIISVNYTMRDPVPAIKCVDGFSISVQASEYTYCAPRVTEDCEYYKFECGFPSAPVPELAQWKDGSENDPDEGCVFGYVPVEVIVKLIESHGGIAP
jgi:hypothetical protein